MGIIKHDEETVKHFMDMYDSGQYKTGFDYFWGAYYANWGYFVNHVDIRFKDHIYHINHEKELLRAKDGSKEFETLLKFPERNLDAILEFKTPDGLTLNQILKIIPEQNVDGI